MTVSLDLYHINYMAIATIICKSVLLEFNIYMRDHPERFVESNTDNSWLRYLNDMCIQGTWSDVLIVQAVADALNVVTHIVESNPGFSPITTVYPVQERNSLSILMNVIMSQPLPYNQMPFQCIINQQLIFNLQ